MGYFSIRWWLRWYLQQLSKKSQDSGMVNWSNQQVSEIQRARRFTVTMAGKEPEDKLLPTLQPNIAQINLRTISSSCHSSLNKSALDYSRNGLVAYASHGVINILELDPKARIGNVKLLSIWFSFCTLGGASNLISIDYQLQLSTNVARFARRNLIFYGFCTLIFSKCSSLRSQKI